MAERRGLVLAHSKVWADALQRVPHDVYHVPAYSIAEARHEGGQPTAFYFSDGEQVLLIPLILRPIPRSPARDAVSPYGYSGPVSTAPAADLDFWRRAASALVDTLAMENVVCAFVRLHPIFEASLVALAEIGEVVEHGDTVGVDLSQSPEAIWSGTRSGHRNEINRARRTGVAVSIDDWERLSEWTSIYHETMTRLGAARSYYYDDDHFAALRASLTDEVHLFLASVSGVVVAGQIVFAGGSLVHTHLSATRTGTRQTHADKLLYDEVRLWAKSRGVAVHHLGGGLAGATDSLFKYKAGFGSGRYPFRTLRVIADDAMYNRLTADNQSRGVAAGAFFPAYRAESSAAELAGG